MELTHYQAGWIEGSDKMPLPQWPVLNIPAYLYGPSKSELTGPLVLEGNFTETSELRLRVQVVSDTARLVIWADEQKVFDELLKSGPGKGRWKQAVYRKEWGIYQNIFELETQKVGVMVGEWGVIARPPMMLLYAGCVIVSKTGGKPDGVGRCGISGVRWEFSIAIVVTSFMKTFTAISWIVKCWIYCGVMRTDIDFPRKYML